MAFIIFAFMALCRLALRDGNLEHTFYFIHWGDNGARKELLRDSRENGKG